MLLKFKVTRQFQYNQWLTDNIKQNWQLEKYIEDDTNKFYSFRFFNIDTSPEYNEVESCFFPIFAKHRDYEEQFFSATEYILKNPQLFKTKKLIPVIIDPLEGQNWLKYVSERMGEAIKDVCTLYVISGDKKLEQTARHFTFYYTNHWVHHRAEHFPMIGFEKDHKTFISLNRVAREHRVKLLSVMLDMGLRDAGYISWADTYGAYAQWQEDATNVMSYTYDILDVPNVTEDNPTGKIPVEFCKKSFLWVVTETHIDNDVMFISEKTYKPIRVGMPFVVLGNPGTLEVLRSFGFKTFSKWIDESYDNDIPLIERCNIISREIQRFSEMTSEERIRIREEMLETCTHNYQHLQKLSYSSDVYEALMDIKNNIAL